jgi:hypothetical protein
LSANVERLLLALLKRLTVVAFLALGASHPAAALDAVSIQLKWKHQFQFAGYYQALEQGFYRDADLDVTIREGGPDIDVSEAVADGKADFGVCSASVLRDWEAGRRLVVLAAIFQRSAAVILVARRADITSVADLRGRTLMDTPGSDDIAAMLKREGIDHLLEMTDAGKQPAAFRPGQMNYHGSTYFGYGLQTWLLPGSHRRFVLQGIHGQAIFVDPQLHLVVVHTAVGKDASGDASGNHLGVERDALLRGIVSTYGSW